MAKKMFSRYRASRYSNIANWLMILFMTIFASHHSCTPYYFSSNTLHYAVQDALIKEYKGTGC